MLGLLFFRWKIWQHSIIMLSLILCHLDVSGLRPPKAEDTVSLHQNRVSDTIEHN